MARSVTVLKQADNLWRYDFVQHDTWLAESSKEVWMTEREATEAAAIWLVGKIARQPRRSEKPKP